MIRDSGFVGFVLIGQLTPFFLSDRASVLIFLMISGLVLLAHLMTLRVSMIVSRRYLVVVELILALSALGDFLLNFPPSWAAFLMSTTLILMLCDWINFRALCRWFVLGRKKLTLADPTLSEYFAILVANLRQLIFDFKDSRRYALGCETGGFFSNIFESVISFFVHIYRLGERVTRVAHIRRFRLGSTCVIVHRSIWSNFAWLANISLLALLFDSLMRLI